ncbi:MAG: pyruvate kinase, partial [Rhizobium sp.]|nr:pyruvate kinase [Rhizobium sp.]
MNVTPAESTAMRAALALEDLKETRARILSEAADRLAVLGLDGGETDPAIENLCHYLALRHMDLRPMQRRLMALGLSSMGRLESRVLPTIDAVLQALAALAGSTGGAGRLCTEAEFFAGEQRLEAATEILFGRRTDARRTRIMVTLPSEAADGPDLVLDLARAGMNVARINCAHDGPEAWRAMTAFVRAAGSVVGRDIKVLMDIAGPKIRTGEVAS